MTVRGQQGPAKKEQQEEARQLLSQDEQQEGAPKSMGGMK